MRGVFVPSGVFFTRDLSFFYWPHHLWSRASLLRGTLPLWDPYVAFGQSAIADPLRQSFFPPALLFRLLPAVPGFNLLVATPVILAALGTFALLRNHVSRPAAALGAIVFALSGPVLSTANSPNMAWSVALAPAVLAAVHALAVSSSSRRMAAVGLLFALQALAGESVSFLGTAVTAVLYAASGAAVDARPRARAAAAMRVGVACLVGLMLAAPQLLPVFRASRLSDRGAGVSPDVLSLHPLRLVEAVAWPLFGDLRGPWGTNDPWLRGLEGSEPLYASTYLGTAALALALMGALGGGARRWRLFWCALGAAFLLLALGRFTPIHQAFLAAVPVARSFRYPAKHAIFTVLALASLAAAGWDALAAGRRGRRHLAAAAAALLVAAASAAGLALLAAMPAGAASALERVARVSALPAPAEGAAYLMGSLPPALGRTALFAALAAVGLWAAPRAAARFALLLLVAADLLVTNGGLNPTLGADVLGEPAWAAAARGSGADRVYIGGRTPWMFGVADPDDPGAAVAPPPAASRAVVGAVYAATFATFPSAWELRDAVSPDLAMLWPREYNALLVDLANAGPEARTRLLRRVGVRYFLTPRPPAAQARTLMRLPGFGDTALYEIASPESRASIAIRYTVVPDTAAQTAILFDERFDPASTVMLEAEPGPAAGTAGPGRGPAARIERDGLEEVVVRVEVPEEGGYHVLMDTYDPEWEVEVDGSPAVPLRANGLFRAVRVASGEHQVRWIYRPHTLRAGAALAAAGLILLAGNFFLEVRARRH